MVRTRKRTMIKKIRRMIARNQMIMITMMVVMMKVKVKVMRRLPKPSQNRKQKQKEKLRARKRDPLKVRKVQRKLPRRRILKVEMLVMHHRLELTKKRKRKKGNLEQKKHQQRLKLPLHQNDQLELRKKVS
jgi:hypothetical protein